MTALSPAPAPAHQAPSTPVVEWGEFWRWFVGQWQQGEHVTMVGPTGWGKTTLATEILQLRRHLVAFAVKREDSSMEELIGRLHMERLREWSSELALSYQRVCLWPPLNGADADFRLLQRRVFLAAMNAIYRQGGWCTYFDEVVYLAETLRLEDELKFFLNQGRSSGISVVAATQRPAFIPLAFYDMATHLFLWKFNDHRNATRVGELTGLAHQVVKREVMSLPKYEFIYINKDTGLRVRSTVEV